MDMHGEDGCCCCVAAVSAGAVGFCCTAAAMGNTMSEYHPMVLTGFKVQGTLQLVCSVYAISVVGMQAVLTHIPLETRLVPGAALSPARLLLFLHGAGSAYATPEARACTCADIASLEQQAGLHVFSERCAGPDAACMSYT